MSEVPEWEDPRRVLARHGLAPKRGFSQNFLTARSVVERIVDALALRPGEPVVELGPGLGTLTAALLRAGAQVTAVDMDHDMLRVLGQELGHVAGFRVLEGDATQVNLAELAGGGSIAVAGNLPYAVTGGIFRRLVSQYRHVDRAVLMVQREVRDRLLAEAGTKAYGALTVFTRGVFEARSVCIVPGGAFHPPPKVESAVVALAPRKRVIDVERRGFERSVRASFEARRKTLRNALQRAYPTELVDAALERASIDGKRRGETLSPEEFEQLGAAFDLLSGTAQPS
ncbi:MAG: 16S rRNA (adenine(1518)-N(6)/adenine(1519)-N(6))-dimethyltransferase RsmA [Myxococcales bacterium]